MICKHCKRPVLKRTAKEHIQGCLKSKQEKARKKKEAREAKAKEKEKSEVRDRGGGGAGAAQEEEEDDEDGVRDGSKNSSSKKNAGAGAAVDDNSKSKAKKRKAPDAEEEKKEEPKKKKNKKEEPKPKTAKTKGPVDVERQCGVVLPNGQQCARSLTCKSHSMGAKRAVPGRSLPYDVLLQAYQKKNQARQQSESSTVTSSPWTILDSLTHHRSSNRSQRPAPPGRRSRRRLRWPRRFRRRTRRDHDRRLARPGSSTTDSHHDPVLHAAKVPTCAHEGNALECADGQPVGKSIWRAEGCWGRGVPWECGHGGVCGAGCCYADVDECDEFLGVETGRKESFC